MTNLTITYGRNVGREPMPRGDWQAFHRSIIRTLETVDAEIFADAAYRGQWNGVYEDARIALAAVDDDVVPAVREALAGLARIFGQESIGLTVGEGDLVSA